MQIAEKQQISEPARMRRFMGLRCASGHDNPRITARTIDYLLSATPLPIELLHPENISRLGS